MDKDRVYYLHERFLNGTLTAAENKEWQAVINDPQWEDQLLFMIDESWSKVPAADLADMPEARAKEIFENIVSHQQGGAKVRSLWPRIRVAAAAAALIVGAALFAYHQLNNHKQPAYAVQKNDVVPGQTGATLTLADGKKIKLTNAAKGELAKEEGVTISKSSDGQILYQVKNAGTEASGTNTLSTAKGETYRVSLPDGSLVYLNAASSLTYPVNFTGLAQRTVKLEGEGYFEVAKDKVHPFIVESRGQRVEVLGTHFNINSYADEPFIKTTLLEGSVKVSKNNVERTLTPGHQSIVGENSVTVKEVDTDIAVAWKNQQFLFESENIQPIMRMISRWYNVDVVYQGEQTSDTFSGGMSRFDQLSKALKSLESTGRVHFKIEGRKLYVSK